MKTLRTSLLLLAFALFGLASTPAFASASLYEYYSTSSAPSVNAAQITSIVGTTLYFADGAVSSITDWSWWIANNPQVGDYLVLSDALSVMSASSFEGEFDLETYAHGGHEPVIIILD
jgi:hypothetical protein